MTKQIKSKQRVADHGEVFTREQEVNAMLDLVKDQTSRPEARFLEPACGDGNFLIEILKRKLEVVAKTYQKSQREYEFYAVLSICSIYGIELLKDNVEACRKRLLSYFVLQYKQVFKESINEECITVAEFILGLNIVEGNALTMCYTDTDKPLHFSQWSPISIPRKFSLKRHDYQYQYLVGNAGSPYQSLQEFKSCYFLDIQNAKPIDKL
nr:DNA methyltransferase [uncultured Haemophilus sp.]